MDATGPLPLIDVAALTGPAAGRDRADAARRIEAACLDGGAFYLTGHGVPENLVAGLRRAAARFFGLPREHKSRVSMDRSGRASRGYFPPGGGFASGRPGPGEGLCFGAEPGSADPRPLHGRNLFPREVPELRPAVLAYMDALTDVGQAVLRGVALSLGLGEDHFAAGCTAAPTVLFRIFHYPPAGEEPPEAAEHTVQGLLTLLVGGRGLQMHTARGWMEAPPIPGALVCGIGDLLGALTGGRYRPAPHRVRTGSGRGRLSFPFVFGPGWDCEMPPLPAPPAGPEGREHRDGPDPRAFTGTYGDYLTTKVAAMFPRPGGEAMETAETATGFRENV